MLSVVVLLATSLAASAHPTEEAPWSEESNGLQGRLFLELSHISSGSGIVATYLELRNVRDLANPLLIRVDGPSKEFRVTDSDGQEVAMSGGFFSGRLLDSPNLVLPLDARIRFPIGPTGYGIPADRAAHLDLGPHKCWSLPRDGKRYFVEGIIEIALEPERFDNNRNNPWHGKLKLPRVEIPTSPPPISPEAIGPRIQELGEKMLDKDYLQSERAERKLSLIDDPRVVSWYVQAVKSNSYTLRMRALDRLAYFESDNALEGIEIGARTRPGDVGSSDRLELRRSIANNIRHAAAHALARSTHPDAKRLLLAMHQDPSRGVKVCVAQTAARMNTERAREVLDRLTRDSDKQVREEAKRLLTLQDD